MYPFTGGGYVRHAVSDIWMHVFPYVFDDRGGSVCALIYLHRRSYADSVLSPYINYGGKKVSLF